VLQLKLGIQLQSLRLPLRKALLAAQQLGAAAVEVDARTEVRPQEFTGTALRQLRKLLDDLNLRVGAVSFRTRHGYNVAEGLDARVAATKAAMKFAHDLGAAVVINQVGRVPDDETKSDWSLLVEVLRDLGHYGHHAGAWLAADTGSESGPSLARLVAALPVGALGVNLNPGNLIVNGFSPLEAVEALGGNVMHVHANDAVRDLARGRGLETQLGRGAVDYPALLGALEEHDYRGYLTVERQAAEEPAHEIGQAIQYLRSL